MSELRRLGELVDFDSEYREGDRRTIRGFETLAETVLLANEKFGLKEFYICNTPKKWVSVRGISGEVEIGDYEGLILDKLLNSIKPVICIKGRMGSGKTTTLQYVLENYIEKIDCGDCKAHGHACNRIIAWVDFKHLITEEKATVHNLVDMVCTQLWSKCIKYIDDDFELNRFWEHLLLINERDRDHFVESVVGIMLSEYPEIMKENITANESELVNRKEKRNEIRSKNPIWYLKYLILLYRYILQTRFWGHRECTLIILDNVDSLSTDLQRNLVRIITGCAHPKGPVFVILVRPETFERNGLNDVIPNVIAHESPEPHQVICDRLKRFIQQPEQYFQLIQTLTDNEKSLSVWYLKKILPKLEKGIAFRDFVRGASGKNIRNALELSRGIFQLSLGDIKHRDLTPHYFIRAMIRLGPHQYRSYRNPRIINPFDVEGVSYGRYLMKIRLLKYIAGHGGVCKTPTIISNFSLFNSFNFEANNEVVTVALEELLSNECQLLASNGFDAFHITPDDDQDEISVTEIGKGYVDSLIYNIHFIQEVMLDARVPTDFLMPSFYTDKLSEKISVMINFLKKVHQADVDEVNTFINKGLVDYSSLFQARLISEEIISNTFEHTKNLLRSRKVKKRKEIAEQYENVISEFQELVYQAKASNNRLLGISSGIYPEPE